MSDTTSQKSVFLGSEGDQWYDRNQHFLDANRAIADDPTSRGLERVGVHPQRVLEIGCATGWRLDALRKTYRCEAYGIEPSQKAIDSGKQMFPQVNFVRGTADHLPFDDGKFDLVLFGGTIAWCDPADLFRIAAEADRVLQSPGVLSLCEFCTPVPYKNQYLHTEGLNTHKMDYGRAFGWHPAYSMLYFEMFPFGEGDMIQEIDCRYAVQIFGKHLPNAFQLRPPKFELD